MSRSRVLVVFALVVLMLCAACTGGDVSGSTARDAELTGRVVILDGSGQVTMMEPGGENPVELAESSGEVRRFQPIWSPTDQTVAWSEDGPDGASIVVADMEGVVNRIASPAFPFYLNWSPDGRLIGALMNGPPGELDFAVYDVEEGTGDVLDSGSPFYFSWSPDSAAIVAHVSGDSILIYDESGEPTSLGTTRADYLAPVWTATGIIYRNPAGVVIADNAEAGRVLATSGRFLNFTANRVGTKVAVQPLTGAQPTGITVGLGAGTDELANDVVTVVDVQTGQSEVVSGGIAAGMFWSPDGDKLMMPVIASGDGEVDITVWDGGETTTIATMRLSGELVSNALQFGDQYAQSWEVWDPDSTTIVFPGTIDDESGIWMLRLDGEPELIADGSWAAWSSG